MKVLRVVVVASATLSVAAAVAAPNGARRAGRQPDGSVVTSSNQDLRPVGQQVALPGRAAAVALRPDGRTAAVLGTIGSPVNVVDLARRTVVDRAAASLGKAASRGIVYAPDGSRLYVSFVDGWVLRFPVARDGSIGTPYAFRLRPVGSRHEIPAGLAVSRDGRLLYVAFNRSNALGVLDARSGRTLARIPVGNAPNEVVLTGRTAIVSNGGGRRARRGDRTNSSARTPIVSTRTTGAAATGTVSLVDVATRRVRAHVRVGLHPGGIAVRGRYAFVADANSDTISVVDVPRDRLASRIAVRPYAGAPFGSSPNAVATYGANQLLVTLGRNNALAVYTWRSPSEPARFDGLLPTGWYPSSVAVARTQRRIVVVNSKGTGPGTVPGSGLGYGTVGDRPELGSVSLMAYPSKAALRAGLLTVSRNNGWANAAAARAKPRKVAPVAIPERLGEPSLIKHVFYVIKENRTYDQILGDDKRGNGDPRYLHFGAHVTPNQHLLATRFPLLDNFYASGTASPDAHQWATQGTVTDYIEHAYGGFPRSYPYHGGDALAYAPTGFLWDNAERHGRSVRVYGEMAKATTRSGTYSDIPSLDRVLVRHYPSFDLKVSDARRADILIGDLTKQVAKGQVADLTIVQLPRDHTRGLSPKADTPESDVADNDVALGRLVDMLSHSKIWPRTAVFVFEDDAQLGLDHVDGHRVTAFVASPYARTGAVDSTYYTQLNMIRTMEQILGLPPMNQMDLAATPMTGAFTNTPDLTPFTAVPRLVPVTRNRPLSELTGLAREWAEASAAMDFAIPDAAPEQQLNRAIWYSVRGFVPYPGDGRVLSPREVADRYDEPYLDVGR